jgi:hypothetical protein
MFLLLAAASRPSRSCDRFADGVMVGPFPSWPNATARMGGKKGEPHRVVGSPANRHGGRINHGSTPIRVRKVGNRIVPYYSFELSDFVGAQLMTLTERPHVDVNKFGESFDVFRQVALLL